MTMLYLGRKRGVFSKVIRKISAHVNGGPRRGLVCKDPRARTPIGVSGNSNCLALAVYRNIHDLIPTIEIS